MRSGSRELAQGGRDADDHRFAGGEVGVVGAGPEAVAKRRQGGVGDVLDVAAALAEGLDLARVDVEADDLVAGLGEGYGERQPDVAEPDDPDLHRRECRCRVREGPIGCRAAIRQEMRSKNERREV